MNRFLVVYAVMVAAAGGLVAWSELPSLLAMPSSRAHLWGGLGAAGVLSAAIVLGCRALESVPWYRAMAGLLRRVLQSPDLLGTQLDGSRALVLAVYSAVGEEALFRGFLQPWLVRALAEGGLEAGPAAALGVVAASLIFGLLHFPLSRELVPWTVFAIVVGGAFGALALLSGSLLAPTVAHFLVNWLNMLRLTELELDEPEPPEPPQPL